MPRTIFGIALALSAVLASPLAAKADLIWQATSARTITGNSGCHFEYECSNQTGYAEPILGTSCSSEGSRATCYWTDSASGCSGGRVQGFWRIQENYTCVATAAPVSVSLSASPSNVPWYGGKTSLTWSVSGATSCTASGDWSGSQDASDGTHSATSSIFPLSGDHSYTITCTGAGGSSSASATVVMGKNAAPSVTIAPPTDGSVFQAGDTVPIGANASDSDGTVSKVEIFVDSKLLAEGASASWTAAGAGTHTIKAVATDNAGAQSSDSVSVSVTVPPVNNPAPSVSISSSPSSVSWWTGGTVALAWSVSGATSCTASGDWSGSKDSANGSHAESVSISSFSSAKTYTIGCTGPGGKTSDSTTVNVGNSDLCKNIAGEQTSVPAGYTRDGSGNCNADVTNTPGNPGTPTDNGGNGTDNGGGTAGTGTGAGTGSSSSGSNTSSCSGGKQWSGSACVCPSGTVDAGGICSEPSFSITGDNHIPLKTLGSVDGSTSEIHVFVNPFAGFTSPVALSVESLRDASGAPANAKYEWRAKETLSYDPALGAYSDSQGIGAGFTVTIDGQISKTYYLTLRGISGGKEATYVIELDKQAFNPSFIEN